VSAEVELPEPAGYDPDGVGWWRLSNGERVYVLSGAIYSHLGAENTDCVEYDALVWLAAVAAARRAVTTAKGGVG
jgi:hypothetical protein